MDITEILTKGGPEAIIAGLFIYVLTLMIRHTKEQQDAHRAEIKDMRSEHTTQINKLAEDFRDEIKNISGEFTLGLGSMKDGLNHIADEVRDLKVRINIKTEIHER